MANYLSSSFLQTAQCRTERPFITVNITYLSDFCVIVSSFFCRQNKTLSNVHYVLLFNKILNFLCLKKNNSFMYWTYARGKQKVYTPALTLHLTENVATHNPTHMWEKKGKQMALIFLQDYTESLHNSSVSRDFLLP